MRGGEWKWLLHARQRLHYMRWGCMLSVPPRAAWCGRQSYSYLQKRYWRHCHATPRGNEAFGTLQSTPPYCGILRHLLGRKLRDRVQQLVYEGVPALEEALMLHPAADCRRVVAGELVDECNRSEELEVRFS